MSSSCTCSAFLVISLDGTRSIERVTLQAAEVDVMADRNAVDPPTAAAASD